MLIHSATGGVGLAALQICRHAGAEVFATAGTEAKRDQLRSLGVEHVFDSRTLAFADEVRAATSGGGVDVVLNSLVGAAIPAGLAALAPRGRFVEIGKRDVYAGSRIGLESFKENLALFVVDLARSPSEDPTYVAGLFRDVMGLVADGQLAPLPVTAAPIDAATTRSARWRRRLIPASSSSRQRDEPVLADAECVRPDWTYLITGGLGALGLAVAQRFVERGARHLALVGRSAPAAAAAAAVAALRAAGADVRVVAADVADHAQLAAALATVRATMPPLRGVVHAAGSLADATLDGLDAARLHAALAPKMAGAWNLHLTTLDDPLDFFVLFSSVAATLGLAGQANYAAGNAFLDALAEHRRAAGLPALSIDWGPWAGIGLAAAAADRGDRLAAPRPRRPATERGARRAGAPARRGSRGCLRDAVRRRPVDRVGPGGGALARGPRRLPGRRHTGPDRAARPPARHPGGWAPARRCWRTRSACSSPRCCASRPSASIATVS